MLAIDANARRQIIHNAFAFFGRCRTIEPTGKSINQAEWQKRGRGDKGRRKYEATRAEYQIFRPHHHADQKHAGGNNEAAGRAEVQGQHGFS